MNQIDPLTRAVRLLVHCFARPATKWQRQGNGTWKSAGGRVLSDASYQAMQARLKAGKAPPKGGAPTPAPIPPPKPKPDPEGDRKKGTDNEIARGRKAAREHLAAQLPKDKKRLAELDAGAAGRRAGGPSGEALGAEMEAHGLRARIAKDEKVLADLGGAKAESEALPPGTKKNVYGQPIPAEAGALPGEPGYKPREAKPRPAKAKPPESMKLGAAPPPYGSTLTPPGSRPATGDSSDAANRSAYEARKAKGEIGAEYMPDVDYTKPMGPRAAPPPKPPKLPDGMPPVPPPAPADLAYIDAAHKKDTQRFGAKAAEFLRGSLAYAVGMLTAGNGAAWGALAGLAVGGPLGLAVGTAVGGGLGARLGGNAAKKTYSILGGAGRAQVMARKAARATLPKVAAATVGGLGVAGAAAIPAMTGSAGSLAGPVGQVLGTVAGLPLMVGAQRDALDLAAATAKATRWKLAKSKAAKRKASAVNKQKSFAEHFADAPADLDPVVLLRARLKAVYARRGEPCPEIDDKVILSALAMAGLAADEKEKSAEAAAMAEGVHILAGTARRLTRARR